MPVITEVHGCSMVEGTTIRVLDVAYWHENGLDAAAMLERAGANSNATLDDIKAAVAYYEEHPQQIERQLAWVSLFMGVAPLSPERRRERRSRHLA